MAQIVSHLSLVDSNEPANSQVQSAKDQNPLALPWFSGKHSSPCSICEDLWKVAWSAREDFLRDLKKSEGEKGYQLVASSGDNLRFVLLDGA